MPLNYVFLVKKSIRERSSRRGREQDTRASSSSPERDSVKSDKSLPKSFRRSSRGSSHHEKWAERSPGKSKRGRSGHRRRSNSDIKKDENTSGLMDEISRELLAEKSGKPRQVSVAKSPRAKSKRSSTADKGRSETPTKSQSSTKMDETPPRKKMKKDIRRERRKGSVASIDIAARARNISLEENDRKEKSSRRKREVRKSK